ncbi:unnamed protein product [Rotaria magnacalcarata]|uniref:Uncharacterized protein n=1 Tax=Rotaria magnacalcarata TaxID=392030 RepID=A0A8S2NNJ5_9BILA|nr:unnamed protein product [Rotaria magnacalcarata]CAF4010857.1 unnamed protein product [Rotaria magnacalcarata]
MKNPHIYATPLTREGSLDLNCSICNERTENIILPITHQVHHQCPSFIVYHLSRTTFYSVMNLHVELTDYKQKKHLYKPSTVLLIDEYNSISVIQLDEVLATAVSTSTSIQFNQPISVRPLNKCTNKLTVGSIRSLKIVPQ